MKIYDEITKKEIVSEIDSSKGYTYNGKIVSGHVDEKSVIMEGSVSELWPDGMTEIIPGYDVYEECKFYHAYTEKELKAIQDEKDRLAKEEADRLAAEAEEEKRRKEAEEAAKEAAKAQAEAARIQAEKEKAWNTGLDKINEIDAQITYTAMMTNTLLNDESDSSDNNNSSTENKTETDNTSTKEDTNNEQSNG